MANKTMKRYSALLVSRKIQIKTMKMAMIQGADNRKRW